ncbi:MAG: N-acetylmuramoyl-L-alanine amidase [Candidatus Acidiferrales bacterium]
MASVAIGSSTRTLPRAAALALSFLLFAAFPARADKKSGARDQFERAVKMRTMLEGYLEKDRSREDYVQTVAAYHKVYMITPEADDATSALIAEAELYREMGRLYDPAYFKSAVDTYRFLVQEYPGSRYRGEVLFSIAQIQNDDQHRPEAAEATYKEYLKRFPHSEKADQARAALKEIADQSAPQGQDAGPGDKAGGPMNQLPAALQVEGPHVTPAAAEKGAPIVKDLQTWNSQDSARIVIKLADTIQYTSARIASPERIYFDLYKARLGPKLPGKAVSVQGGLLNTVRIAQNKPDTVRLVLDVTGAKDYSAFLVANPYRLVIDIHSQPVNTAKAAASPAAAPPAASAAAERPAANPPAGAETVSVSTASKPVVETAAKATDTPGAAKPAPKISAKSLPRRPIPANSAALQPPPEPKPNHDGERSLTRALGLKINRIVIDAGHGGHDTGTIGPHGLMEKDLCLDVALRLGALIEKELPGADVLYTRKDDTFIPLEERTRIANDAKADLFISIHANSSHDPSARGIETYYLNFATSEEAMEVAARENAYSEESMHDLQDLIKKIARNDKIEESKDLADDIQDNLTERLQLVSRGEKNRGVKKAPFVVLIGANMPSVLSEISFVSNPNDERLLRKGDQRQRIADGLYHGISTYLEGLNSLSYNKGKLVSDNHVSDTHIPATIVAPAGNPK